MTISAAHRQELKRIYEAIDSTWSLLTLDNLLTQATNIAEEYSEDITQKSTAEQPAANPKKTVQPRQRRKEKRTARLPDQRSEIQFPTGPGAVYSLTL